ncbi:uncharacterized protein LOC124663194 [Lolium rigidum]|uniref:uncharacterized protein LOC124663194 n=1 Tax=Lolium rigidum TaxID=89674 RepID=UPI001F5E2AA4|nr:uncharacterized protein LOC124663194 [Lolium rigidum]
MGGVDLPAPSRRLTSISMAMPRSGALLVLALLLACAAAASVGAAAAAAGKVAAGSGRAEEEEKGCRDLATRGACVASGGCRWCRSEALDDMCFGAAEAWRLPNQVFSCDPPAAAAHARR